MPSMSLARRLLLSCALLATCGLAAAAPRVALVTALDGDAVVLRDDTRLSAAEGVALQAGDILVTGAQTRLLRIETTGGLSIAFGAQTEALLSPGLAGDAAPATVYLLAGWAKLGAPKAVAATLVGPRLQATTTGGTAVFWLRPGADRVFAETGPLALQARPGGSAIAPLAAGEMVTLTASGAKPETSSRPAPAFVQAMPRAFMDSIPSRAAFFQGKEVAPKELGPLAYADAQPWIDAEPALRRAFVKRWRGLAHDADFRRGLVAGLKTHPEWEPVLYPPTRATRTTSGAAPAH